MVGSWLQDHHHLSSFLVLDQFNRALELLKYSLSGFVREVAKDLKPVTSQTV
jgi:hypothetical protein